MRLIGVYGGCEVFFCPAHYILFLKIVGCDSRPVGWPAYIWTYSGQLKPNHTGYYATVRGKQLHEHIFEVINVQSWTILPLFGRYM